MSAISSRLDRIRNLTRSSLLVLLSFLLVAALAILPQHLASAQVVTLSPAASTTSAPAAPVVVSPTTTQQPTSPPVPPPAPVTTTVATTTTTATKTTVTPVAVPPTAVPNTVQSTVKSTAPQTTAPQTTAVHPTGQHTVVAATTPITTTRTTTTAAPTSIARSTHYVLSAAAKAFLSSLHLSVGTGTLTGTLNGSVLTVKVGAPVLPVTLPIGGQKLTFSGATLTIDESTNTLTLTANAGTTTGFGAQLRATIAHASTTTLGTASADLSATVTVTGFSFFGASVKLSGKLSYAGGKASASLTGVLTADAVVAANTLVLKSGTKLKLSTSGGLTVAGSAVLGSGPTAFTVSIQGAIADLHNWSIAVDDATDTPSFTPIPGLVISPKFTGSISDTKGAIGFDVSGDDVAAFTAGATTLAVHHVEVSNGSPAAGLHCPTVASGGVFANLQGTLTDTQAGLSASAEACVVPSSKAFTITTTAPSNLLPASAGFSITNATVTVNGQLANAATGTKASVSVTAAATLTITAGLPKPFSQAVSISFASDGTFLVSTTVDLGALGLGAAGSSGTLLLSSDAIKGFDPTTVNAQGSPFDLPSGITVLVDYTPSAEVARALAYLKLPATTHLVARATLGTSGFTAAVSLHFGTTDQGAQLLAGPSLGGAAIYLDDLTLGLHLNAVNTTLTVSGSAFVVLPALYPGSTGSQVQVTLGGSLGVTADAVSVNLMFDIAGVNGPWTDAFGIPGLSVDEVAGQIGVEDSAETAGIPLPTISFLVNNLTLPTAWANAIGMQPGSQVSLSVALNVDNPILAISISGPQPGQVALKPFAVVKDIPQGDSVPQSVVDAVQVNSAQLLFAPFGGMDATGATVNPGATLVFDATIAGQAVHVDGAIGLLPYPSLTANVAVSSFSVGPVSLDGPMLSITLKADPTNPVADFSFSGGFTDSYTGIAFHAVVDEGLSMTLAHASIALHIAGGQPAYLQAGADLQGAVTVDNTGVSFAASGYAGLVIAGQSLGTVQFSYTSSGGALWHELQANAALVANAFRSAYGWADSTALAVMRSLGYTDDQIAGGLTYAYQETVAQLTTVFYNTGSSIQTAIDEARNALGASDVQIGAALQQLGFAPTDIANQIRAAFGDSDGQIASAFQQLGYSAGTIGSVLQSVYGDGQAAVYNLLQRIGSGGSSAIDQLAGVFNSGAYSLSTHPWWSVPLLLDVAGGSTDPNAGVIQYVWDAGHNQQWYVLPTDSGYAELVNRNSGQCLAVYGDSGSAGTGLVQVPCTGDPAQQWYLGVYDGNSNIMGQTKVLTNRNSGLVADVAGESTWNNGTIDQWYEKSNDDSSKWNQEWYFGPAVG